jgi:phosphoribosylaminoimidazole-succinocarboxamide synthase
MAKVQLNQIAQARAGDKGNAVNIGLFAPNEKVYEAFLMQVTAQKVKEHFTGLVEGEVVRYELPNILAVNFICKEALDGGGSSTTRLDNLGKCFGANLLRMEIDISDQLLADINFK